MKTSKINKYEKNDFIEYEIDFSKKDSEGIIISSDKRNRNKMSKGWVFLEVIHSDGDSAGLWMSPANMKRLVDNLSDVYFDLKEQEREDK